MQERRREPRRRTYLGGRIVSDDKLTETGCVVRSLSAEGARLALDRDVLVPPEFDLEIARLRSTLRARVAWRGRRELGVSLVDRSAPSAVVAVGARLRLRRFDTDRRELVESISRVMQGG